MRLITSKEASRFIQLNLAKQMLKSRPVAGLAYKLFIREVREAMKDKAKSSVYKERLIMLENLVRSVWKGYKEGRLSHNYLVQGLEIFFNGSLQLVEKRRERENELSAIPLFLTISPTQVCNLHCKGCYAGSSSGTKAQLSFDTVDRILKEKKELWGSFFTVISGGEPLAYRENGKSIYDLFEKHNDQFFLMYTNGTLIDKKSAKKFAELGNVTPAISVEGLKAETEARRGEGVFDKILRAMENLREEGVFFGISMTATRENADRLLRPEVLNFWLDEKGAFYAWMFQYMPIGRAPDLNLMVTLEQRLNLYMRTREIIHKERRFVVDFWNNGPITRGCISSGRDWGYYYIDWNGNIMPCVFVPYWTHNVKELYAQGKTLDDAHKSYFYKRIRDWQIENGYTKPFKEVNNWIAPCFNRDNHKCFVEIIGECQAHPADEWAELAWEDEEYHQGLIEYGEKFKKLSQPLWEKFYLSSEIDKNAT